MLYPLHEDLNQPHICVFFLTVSEPASSSHSFRKEFDYVSAAAAGKGGANSGPGGRYHQVGAKVPGGEHNEAICHGCSSHRSGAKV